VRLVIFPYLCIKICALPANTVYIFFVLKGTYQRNRCTLQNSIKSHIFIFDSAPCQIPSSLHLHLHHIFFLHTNKGNNYFSFSKGTYQRKRCTFKNNIKSHIFILQCALSDFFIFTLNFVLPTDTVYNVFLFPKVPSKEIGALSKKTFCFFAVCPVRFLYLCIKICVLPTYTVLMFSCFKGTYQRNRCTFKNNIKSHIFILQCALSDFFIFASKFVLFLLTQFEICFSFQRYLSKK